MISQNEIAKPPKTDYHRLALLRNRRLKAIAEIIEGVENRCAAVDGEVTPTLEEMTQSELSAIYRLAKGNR